MPGRSILFALLMAATMATAVAAEQFARIGTSVGTYSRFPVDARGEAMGLATTVNPTGPTAFWWNPAPLPESDRVMASYTAWDYPIATIDWRPLAIRASLGNLTFGYLWGEMSLVARTAYEPDGPGMEVSDNLHQFSLAADLVPWLTSEPSAWTWTVGANARYYYEHFGDTSYSTWDADLGTSLAWLAVDDETASLRVHGTFMVRNLFRGTFDYGRITAPLPRYYHFGTGLEAGVGSFWRGNRMITATASYTWRRDLEDIGYPAQSEHFGFEILVAGVAALRSGYRTDGSYIGDGWSGGGGLQYRLDVWWGIRAAVDYARVDVENALYTGSVDHWTFTAGFDLP